MARDLTGPPPQKMGATNWRTCEPRRSCKGKSKFQPTDLVDIRYRAKERKRSAGTQLLALATDKTTLVSALLQKQLLMPATMNHAQIAYQYSTGRQTRRGSVPRLLHIPESHANNAAPLHTRRYSSPVLSLFLRPQFALPHTAAIIVLGAGHGRLSSKPQPRLDEAT